MDNDFEHAFSGSVGETIEAMVATEGNPQKVKRKRLNIPCEGCVYIREPKFIKWITEEETRCKLSYTKSIEYRIKRLLYVRNIAFITICLLLIPFNIFLDLDHLLMASGCILLAFILLFVFQISNGHLTRLKWIKLVKDSGYKIV